MRKIYLLLEFSICIFLAANPRDFVAVLHCSPNNEREVFLKETADIMAGKGMENMAASFRTFAEGWYGSGFVIESDNNLILLTNKHVTGSADNIKVTFHQKNGNILELSGDYPIFQDRYTDLALIDLPDELLTGIVPVTLQAGGDWLTEGEDVYAAGYPILLGEPSWQLTKGVVSNKIASVNAIISADIIKLIQHTAAIDPGNSGGPLLRKLGDQWIAVGINTWSVSDRNNTFFSIPYSRIEEFLSDYSQFKQEESEKIFLKEILDRNVRELVHLINDDTWDSSFEHWELYRKYVEANGTHAFLDLLNEDEDKIVDVGSRFYSQSPMQILRESALWKVWDRYRVQLHGGTLELVSTGSIPYPVSQGDRVISILRFNDKEMIAGFRYYRGDWLLDDIEFPYSLAIKDEIEPEKTDDPHTYDDVFGESAQKRETNEPPKTRNSRKTYLGFAVTLIPGIQNLEYAEEAPFLTGYGATLFWITDPRNDSPYYSSYMDISFIPIKSRFEYSDEFTSSEIVEITYNTFSYNYGLELHLPIEGDRITFEPYLLGAGGVTFSFPMGDPQEMDPLLFGLFVKFGCGFKIITQKDWGLGMNVLRRIPFFQVTPSMQTPALNDFLFSLNLHF